MRAKKVATPSDDVVALGSPALASGRLHWDCRVWNGSAVFADSSMPNAHAYWSSLPLMRNDQVGAISLEIRYCVVSSLSTIWSAGIHRGARDSRDVGVAENTSCEHREGSRFFIARTLRYFVDLEYRVQSHICLSANGKKTTNAPANRGVWTTSAN